MEAIVFLFVISCLFAASPIITSLPLKATTEGMVLFPSGVSKTFGFAPSMTQTHEFVVPKSIPIIVFFILFLLK